MKPIEIIHCLIQQQIFFYKIIEKIKSFDVNSKVFLKIQLKFLHLYIYSYCKKFLHMKPHGWSELGPTKFYIDLGWIVTQLLKDRLVPWSWTILLTRACKSCLEPYYWLVSRAYYSISSHTRLVHVSRGKKYFTCSRVINAMAATP